MRETSINCNNNRHDATVAKEPQPQAHGANNVGAKGANEAQEKEKSIGIRNRNRNRNRNSNANRRELRKREGKCIDTVGLPARDPSPTAK